MATSVAAFEKWLQALLPQAAEEALASRSATIDAQHLLLAIAAQPETTSAQVLSSAGLDHRALREAIQRELEHSLGAAGVSLVDFELPRASSDPARSPSLGASAQQAIERGVTSAGKAVQPPHLLLGILGAERGTVPRALALAGIDRLALLASVRQALAE
jgi:ATP-dependent Clp protease ATP-binding subunit ClpA